MFDELVAILEDELERQENVLAQCRAQREAVRLRDVPALEARSNALQHLYREAAAAEPRRLEILCRVAAELGIQCARPTLAEIMLNAPAPWDERLRHLQARLRQTLHESRGQARENAAMLRRSLRQVSRCLQVFQIEAPTAAGHYSPSGQQAAAAQPAALLINQRG
jgi:16S rRNA U1498 N3-methylase RsmE